MVNKEIEWARAFLLGSTLMRIEDSPHFMLVQFNPEDEYWVYTALQLFRSRAKARKFVGRFGLDIDCTDRVFSKGDLSLWQRASNWVVLRAVFSVRRPPLRGMHLGRHHAELSKLPIPCQQTRQSVKRLSSPIL